jgi:hypothetical protein
MTSLSGCFWDRVFSITGFRRRDIESLRDSSVNGGGSSSSDRDVIESISLVGTDWTDQAAVHTVRKELQEYVSLLRSLKAENKSKSQTRVHVRNYVDDARYSALRQREAAQRVTVAKVAGSFRTLRFDDCDIAQLTAEEPFPAVEDLRLSRNRLTELTFVPANVRVLTVASNRIRHVEIPSVHDKLLYLSLSANDLVDLAFLEHFPSLVMLDVSFNAISSVDDVVTMLDAVPTITEVDLRGNPVCFAEGYRRRVCSAVPTLQVLDGEPVADSDRQPPLRENPRSEQGFASCAALSVVVTGVKDFALALNTAESEETPASAQVVAAPAKGKAAKPDAKGKKTGGKADAPEASGGSSAGSTKRVLSLECQWGEGAISCGDVESAALALGEAESPSEGATNTGKGGKGAAKFDKKASIAPLNAGFGSDASGIDSALVGDVKCIARGAWTIGSAPRPVARDLAAPCIFVLTAEDTITAPSANAVAGDAVGGTPAVSTKRFTVGRVTFDFSALAVQPVLTPTPPHEAFTLRSVSTASVVVDRVAIAERKYVIAALQEDLKALQERETSAERQLALLKSPTPAGDPNEISVASPGKPGAKKAPSAATAAKGGKSPAPTTAAPLSAASEEIAKLQESVSSVKAAIEEKRAAVAAEQRALAAHVACSGVELTAVCTIMCRGPDTVKPPEPEVDAAAPSPKEAAKKGKK